MDTNTEITDLKKADREFPPDQIGRLEAPTTDEVGGRGATVYYSRCSACGFVGTTSDTRRFPAQQCSSCGTVLAAGH